MFFKLENVGKIKRAEVELHGITVITGNNRTGKSTVGKMLYCIFSAFRNGYVYQERENAFCNIWKNYLLFPSEKGAFPQKIFHEYHNDIFNSNNSEEKIREKIESIIRHVKAKLPENIKEEFYKEVVKLLKTTDETIQRSIFDRYLQVEFSGNVNHVNTPEETARVYAKMKADEIEIEINNNLSSCIKKQENVFSDIFYIDTSFALDDLNNNVGIYYSEKFYLGHKYKLESKLTKTNLDANVINDIEAKEKIAKIFKTIVSMPEEIRDGNFISENGRLLYKEKKHSVALDFNSVSAGMKPFLTIKRLMESAEIKRKSVIVLDEPEVNLHPEWQLFFAEFIVLLQKEYDATILLATHSPYFLEAIEVFGKKHEIEDKCRYYLARNEDDIYSVIEDVTQETNKIYDLFANPFRKLSSMAAL